MANRLARRITEKRNAKSIRRALDAMSVMFKLAWIPGTQWHPWLRPEKTDMRWLPINTDIEMPEDTPMPLAVLDAIIEKASHRVIFDYCGCRKAYGCEHYPHEIGCLLMGDSALEGNPNVSHEVTVDEAKTFARKAVDAGLVPIIGKARIDNALFSIKDRHRLVTVCFCCECCCITRNIRHLPIAKVEPLFPPLESVTIEVTDECKGCGKCAKHCYIEAITIVDEHAVISEYCRACGRCATVCPSDAIRISLNDPDFVEKTIERIGTYVKYD
jgi:UDP-glucose 4-epimerase